ncbi:MAG TPA: lipopolysaccharide kinase InaA family protein [Candidatus Saccharimonadales bacterium]|jgi:hypothetical protein|nr:lipopolysaccharide kinase InaA family protein [Candidatus Saccharimonadales bacterium]
MSERLAAFPDADTPDIFPSEFFGSVYVSPEEIAPMMPSVVAFQETFRRLGEPRVVTLLDAPLEAGKSSLTEQATDGAVFQMGESSATRLYVDSDERAQELSGNMQSMRISRTSIAETSAHGVFFTKMSGSGGTVRVAVKRFENGPRGAVQEWANTKLAAERGFGAFQPLGYIAAEDTGYMLTYRRDDVESLDNSDWTRALRDPEAHQSMLEDISKVGPLLARLHHEGAYHGDAQLKNIVIDQMGQLDFNDWESSTFTERPTWSKLSYEQADSHRHKIERDLKVLFGSLARSVEDKGVGLLTNLTPQAQTGYFREFIMTPYIEARLQLLGQDSPDADAAMVVMGEVEDAITQYISTGELQRSLARARQRMVA